MTHYVVSALFLLLSSVAAQDCNIPFQPIEGGCYFYDETLYIDSFAATVNFCSDIGGYPVVVTNGGENRALIDHIYPDNLLGDVVLLGATRNENDLFEWVDGTLVRDEFDHWYPGEPDGSGDCMAWAAAYAMYWDDIQCGDFNGTYTHVAFVCEQDVDPGSTPEPSPTPEPTPTPTPPPTGCPDPFVELETGCYYASEGEREFWDGARLVCEALTGHLAVITSSTEQEAINAYLDTVYPEPTDDVWIGLYDEAENNVFVWIDGSEVTYENWAPGEPDGDNQDHVFMSDTDGWMWGNELGSVAQFFLCEADYVGSTPSTTDSPTTTPVTNSSPGPSTLPTTPPPGECTAPFEPVDGGCYYASDVERRSWSGARIVCEEELGGHLAIITSQQEQDALATYLNTVYPDPTDDVWIGGFDELQDDQWVWVDGTAVSFTSWAPGEPDAGNQDHMFMSDTDGWNWANELDPIEQFFLCEQD